MSRAEPIGSFVPSLGFGGFRFEWFPVPSWFPMLERAHPMANRELYYPVIRGGFDTLG